jgi:hypothetical protein
MCKHLLALGEFLKTKLAPETPEPKPNKYDAWKPEPKVKKVDTTPPAQKPQTTDAPDPDDDTYTDSRTGSDTMTEEVQRGVLYERMEKFVKENPEFTVMYEDDTD